MVSPTYWKKNTQSKFEGTQGKQSTQTWHFLNWSQVTDAQKFVLDLRTQSRVFWHHNSQWWWEDKVNLTDLSWSTIWGQTVPQLSSECSVSRKNWITMHGTLSNKSDSILIRLISASSANEGEFHEEPLPLAHTSNSRKERVQGFSSHNCSVWSSAAP